MSGCRCGGGGGGSDRARRLSLVESVDGCRVCLWSLVVGSVGLSGEVRLESVSAPNRMLGESAAQRWSLAPRR